MVEMEGMINPNNHMTVTNAVGKYYRGVYCNQILYVSKYKQHTNNMENVKVPINPC